MTMVYQSAPPTEAELAVAFGGPQQSSVAEPAKVVPPVRWLTNKKRITEYPLEHPFVLHGVEYWNITVRRLQAHEVERFMDKMRDGTAGSRFPLYFTGEIEMSDEVWDALDDDDRFALGEIGTDFLPARFRQGTEAA